MKYNKLLRKAVSGLYAAATIFLMVSVCSCAPKEETALVSNEVFTDIQTYPSNNLLAELCSSVQEEDFGDAGPEVITAYASEDGYTVLWGDEETCFLSLLTGEYEVVESYPLAGTVPGTAVWILESGKDWIIFSSGTDEYWHIQYYATRVTKNCEVVTASVCLTELCDTNVTGVERIGDFLAAVADNVIYIFNGNFSQVKRIESKNIVTDIALASDGFLYAAENIEVNGKYSVSITVIDTEIGKVKNRIQIKGIECVQINSLFGSSSGFKDSLCLCSAEGIYIYSLADAVLKRIIPIQVGRIGVQTAYEVIQMKDNHLFIWGNYCVSGASEEIAMLVDAEILQEAPQKDILTLGVLSVDQAGMIVNICDYVNAQALPFAIEIVPYVNQEDMDKDMESAVTEGHKKLLLDIFSDNSPDLLCLSPSDRELFDNQSALVPIDSLIDKSNKISRNDFLENIWNASETGGTNCWVTPFVSISGIAATETNAALFGNGSVEEIFAMAQGSSNPLCRFGSNMGLFYPSIQSKYIDFENGNVNMNSEEFLSLLSLMAEINDEKVSSLASGSEEPMIVSSNIQSFLSYIHLSETRKEPVIVIGYPEMEEEGPTIHADTSFAISAKSQHIQEAMQFIEYILSDDIQNMYASLGSGQIPIQKAAFDNMILWDAIEYEKQLQSGIKINSSSKYMKDGVVIDFVTPCYPVDINNAMMQRYRDIVSSAKTYYSLDMSIYSIVSEELEYYFDGTKTADETAGVLNDRLSILVSERMK